MSKATKIIAGLGVVAGLGVAALPAMTYAISTDGAVKLSVDVEPAIALTINSTPADPASTAGDYFNTTPTGIQGNWGITGTQYTKGAELFSNWSSAKVSMTQNAVNQQMQSVVKVYTNNAGGYTLTLADEDEDNTLRLDASNAIDAIETAGAITAGAGEWGYHKVVENDTIGADTVYSAVPASDDTAAQIAQTSAVSASTGDPYTINYGVATAAVQATGTYSDVIVYTATTR